MKEMILKLNSLKKVVELSLVTDFNITDSNINIQIFEKSKQSQ